MEKNIIYVTAIALVDWEGKVLLSLRSRKKILANYWEFPGGKIKKNEEPDDAIIRELYEELDIIVEKQFLKPFTFTSYDYKDFKVIIFFYLCRLWSGKPRSKEKQKLLWVKINQINNYKILPANKTLVSELLVLNKKK